MEMGGARRNRLVDMGGAKRKRLRFYDLQLVQILIAAIMEKS